uniref:NADH-ubiquinone oxidoreductase chain 2 n=1 Tax=Haementeria acuecueyetzin TaxID=1130134 RepID=A0A7D7KN50_9ANNE|nr:NADH dehydrogenase subunit 2 [Haementeria acuecueyetzin]
MLHKFALSMTSMMWLSLFIMIISTFMAISSSNWFCSWVGLEINMLSFLPFLTKSNKQKNAEAVTKYLIMQACASTIMLYSGYLLMFMPQYMKMSSMILFFAFTMKLGMFPAHYWFPSVVQGCDWMGMMILSTWQKIAPAIILMNNIKQPHIELISLLIFSIILGSLLGLNQTDVKTIMAYSSISHMGWMLLPHMYGMTYQSLYYLIMYFMLFIPILLIFHIYSYNNPNISSNYMYMPINMKLISLLLILSLAGLPPLSGFVPKLMVIYTVALHNLTVMILIVIISCMSLLFYLNLSLNIIMTSKNLMMNLPIDKFTIMSFMMSILFTPLLFMM